MNILSSIANSMFMIQTEEGKEAAKKVRLIIRWRREKLEQMTGPSSQYKFRFS